MKFEKAHEIKIPLSLQSLIPQPLTIYKHIKSNFQVIFVKIPGPLVSANIYVPTLSEDHSGLAHALEHLTFCGSKAFPERGYLDILCTRSFSMGTNAYTCEDHTNYSVVTAGIAGISHVLPVFLDHVLRPTLLETQFITEVCHLDHTGKFNGVVYCEMCARENTEADLLDLSIRQLAFANSESHLLQSYAFECGGRTIDIKEMTLKELKKFHSKFYKLNELTLVLLGDFEVDYHLTLLDGLDLAKFTHSPAPPLEFNHGNDPVELIKRELHLSCSPIILHSNCEFKITRFPSSASSPNASIAFVWEGPFSSDVEQLVVIDALFQYLQSNTASPIQQCFIEGPVMLANDVDLEIKSYLKTLVCLIFSGVPMEKAADSEKEDHETNAEPSEHSEHEQDEEEEDINADKRETGSFKVDFNAINYENSAKLAESYKSILFSLLEHVCNTFSITTMKVALERFKKKFLETIEEDPLAVVSSLLSPDIVSFSYSGKLKSNNDFKASEKYGSRFAIPDIIDSLMQKEDKFWIDFIRSFLLESNVGIVFMEPDSELSSSLTDLYKKELTPKESEKQKQLVEAAVEANKVHLSDRSIKMMPPLPNPSNISKCGSTETFSETRFLSKDDHMAVVDITTTKTDSLFSVFKMGIPIIDIPDPLRPYLVLFQELLFQCPIRIGNAFSPTLEKKLTSIGYSEFKPGEDSILEYQAVVKLLSRDLTYHSGGVGFGNDVFSCSWLNDYFIIQSQIMPGLLSEDKDDTNIKFPSPDTIKLQSSTITHRDSFMDMISWPLFILYNSVFTKSRIVTTVKNLLRIIEEVHRDGSEMVTQFLVSGIHNRTKNMESFCESIDNSIGIFEQKEFLEKVLKLCTEEKVTEVIAYLESLRKFLVDQISGNQSRPLFCQVGLAKCCSQDQFSCVNEILCMLMMEFSAKFNVNTGLKRKYSESEISSPKSGFPCPRPDFELHETHTDPCLAYGVPGVTSCYLIQLVPCDILISKEHHPDFLPLQLLVHLICRNEGPLFSEIRGRGYAYDSGLSLYMWNGQMVFELVDSREPMRALEAFWGIIVKWTKASVLYSKSKEDHPLVNDMEMGTAISQMVYRLKAETSIPAGILTETLKARIQGFESLEKFQNFDSLFGENYDLNAELIRVCRKYLPRFLQPRMRITTMVTWTDPSESLLKAKYAESENISIEMQFKTFNGTL